MAGLNDLIAESGSLKVPKLADCVGGTSNKELMAKARLALSGNWGMAVLGFVLYSLFALSIAAFIMAVTFFVLVVSLPSGSNIATVPSVMSGVSQSIQMLLSGVLTVGFCSFFLVLAQDSETRLEHLFTGFRRFWTAFAAYFLSGLFVLLWMLLLIIPGIIATYRYAMVFFIIADDKDVGPLEAIRKSKEMMKGNKWKLFCLQWRFFWWVLLCSVLPIGYLWLVPYVQTSVAKFYEEIK